MSLHEALKQELSTEETWRLESLIQQFTRFNQESVTNIASHILQRTIHIAKEELKARQVEV